jgi:hydroxyacylglutathione hydrolase
MFFRQLIEPKLAHHSYLIGCESTREAIVIDPQRDLERYAARAEQEGYRIVAAAETHIHADYLSGLREFAERLKCRLYVSDEGDRDWKYEWLIGSGYDYRLLKDGEAFQVGRVQFKAMHTPGHTPEHISFLVSDGDADAARATGILTGDFIFVGDVGRPDLLETAAGQVGSMQKSAERLFESVRRFKELPVELNVWPGHGAGSMCGKALGAIPVSTVGRELAGNPAIQAAQSVKAFVTHILDGQPEPPQYFARMKRDNRCGPALIDRTREPERIEAGELKRWLAETNGTIADTRSWDEYKAGHVPGSVFVPSNSAFVSTAGAFLEDTAPLCLVVSEVRLAEAVTDLARIGLDNVAAYVTPESLMDYARGGGALRQSSEIDVSGLRQRMHEAGSLVLDVRNASELKAEGFIPGARNVAYTRLFTVKDSLPKGRDIYLYCLSGSRSAYACGYLESFGYKTCHVVGGFEAWARAGGAIQKWQPQ